MGRPGGTPVGSRSRPQEKRQKKRPGLLGLKIKDKWLKKMQFGDPEKGFRRPKCVEVRSYQPANFLPKAAKPPLRGDRIFLLCNGSIWGSAKLGSVKKYLTGRAFDADAARHHVTKQTAGGSGALGYSTVKAELKRRGGLFGWHLSDFRWHEEKRRPRAGKAFGGDRGANRVPNFLGMDKGQVWFLGGTIPAGLEAKR
mmetsp:Transcript_36558/g.58988  ORF Transcript_36558/g.58988 Transcript_36558/m.58988 type:complete len:198 (+) Transcript_36558:171-764(+)|eukprot:CAMPEP_0115084642 /NCGR_PEP_ID=MMETSP0227-20121206/21421_1 /TAXON_ID=89957 /ORGANISM="Polarella glacialis, Strain CCMP 1383" /LENGTH=197 /DNA_ID=CAMNT_0002473567 /DNA_START=182 /DNA_END=775 /DNA_ORIENTATION=+